MAKKPTLTPTTLSFRDLVLGADADTLRQALEARVRIDELIAERQAAYERIAALETQVEDVLGEPGVFPFPAPPLPVAGIDAKADSLTRPAAGGSNAVANAAPTGKKAAGRPARPAAPEPAEDDDDEREPEGDEDEAGGGSETDDEK